MPDRGVDIRVRMAGARRAQRDSDKVGKSIRGVGRDAAYTNKRLKFAAQANKRFASSLAGVGRAAKLGAGIGIAAAGAEVIRATKGWQEHQKTLRDITATNTAMGNVSGRSTKQINAQADALEKASGIDADQILSGQKELLTFSNIRGKSFDSASDALAGMVDQGKGAKASAIMMGKALNDPVKGISALSKVGVSFSDQQKDQIKTLVKSGKTMDAQKIILGELKKEFPKTPPTGLEKLQILLRNLEDSLGQKVLPLIQKGATWLTKFADEFAKGTGTGGKFKKILQDIGSAVTNYVIHPLTAAVNWVKASRDRLTALAIGVGVLTAIVTGFGIAAAVAWVQALSPIVFIVAGIALLAAGLYYAYQRVGWFRDAVDWAWTALKNVATWLVGAGVAAWGAMTTAIGAVGDAFDFIKGAPDMVKGVFTSTLNWVIDRINDIIGFMNKAIDIYNKVPLAPDLGHIGTIGHIGGGAATGATAPAGPLGGTTPLAGHMAAGGMVRRSGVYEVGERGRERVWLPGGAAVQPAGGGAQVLEAHLYMVTDGKVTAKQVHRQAIKAKSTR